MTQKHKKNVVRNIGETLQEGHVKKTPSGCLLTPGIYIYTNLILDVNMFLWANFECPSFNRRSLHISGKKYIMVAYSKFLEFVSPTSLLEKLWWPVFWESACTFGSAESLSGRPRIVVRRLQIWRRSDRCHLRGMAGRAIFDRKLYMTQDTLPPSSPMLGAPSVRPWFLPSFLFFPPLFPYPWPCSHDASPMVPIP
jgi:hypothetical protein